MFNVIHVQNAMTRIMKEEKEGEPRGETKDTKGIIKIKNSQGKKSISMFYIILVIIIIIIIGRSPQ